MYCKNCGQEIDDKAEICIKCGIRVTPLPMQQKNPAIAALLSFVIIGAKKYMKCIHWHTTLCYGTYFREKYVTTRILEQ